MLRSAGSLLSLLSFTTASTLPRSSPTYSLVDDYSSGSSFFSSFEFFTGADPTGGHVKFQSQEAAFSSNLAGLNFAANNSIYLGVDFENPAPNGRPALRVASKKTYNVGTLVVLDLQHMPGGICGVWPAFWLLGPNWPTGGEIDVIEGVNDATVDQVTLHTGPGCSVLPQNSSSYQGPKYDGTLMTPDCDVNDPKQDKNAGCGIEHGADNPFGAPFNAAGGGVYAVEWSKSAISIWHFPRGSVPQDITSGSHSPSPSGWGTPAAAFSAQNCDLSARFQPQQIVFDTTFCGDWAGKVWNTSPTCSKLASTCEAYVSNNPDAFKTAYWEINSLRVFGQA
jgi:Glycosyl hydrolases family 16